MTIRLKKVAIPTIVWSIIYLALNGELNFLSVCSIPFSAQGASILWFMYTLIGLYLIAPVISPWLEKADKGSLNFYLAIWAVTLCYPTIKIGLTVNESVEGIFYYATGYIGYFILGYYLKRFDIKFRTTLILFTIAFLIMMSVKLFANDIRLYNHFWYLTIFCAINVIFYWKVLELISNRIRLTATARHYLITVSNLIFGVYFIHYGIIEYVLPYIGYISTMPYLLGYASRIAIAFGGALILSYIISYIPFANYIIGYKHKKTTKL